MLCFSWLHYHCSWKWGLFAEQEVENGCHCSLLAASIILRFLQCPYLYIFSSRLVICSREGSTNFPSFNPPATKLQVMPPVLCHISLASFWFTCSNGGQVCTAHLAATKSTLKHMLCLSDFHQCYRAASSCEDPSPKHKKVSALMDKPHPVGTGTERGMFQPPIHWICEQLNGAL